MTTTTRPTAAGLYMGSLRNTWGSSLLLRIAVLAAAYIFGALLGLSLSLENPNVTAFWPPTGIAVAAVVLYGPRMWPGIAAGAILSNVLNGAPFQTAAAIAVGNTVAPVLAGVLLRRGGFRAGLTRLKDVAALIFVGASGCMLISSILGTIALGVGGLIEPGQGLKTWFEWWVGDASGVSVFAPLVLTASSPDRQLIRRRPREAALLFGLTFVATIVVFETTLPLKYLVFPLAIWAALRFHQLGSSILTLLISGVAIWQRARGHGPFADFSLAASVLSLQGFNAAVALTSLSLSAVMVERTRAQEDLRRAAAELEGRVAERTGELAESERRMREAQALAHIGSFHWDIASNEVTWTDELYRIYGLERQDFAATVEGYLAAVHPEDRPRIEATIAEAVRTGGTYEHEYRVIRPTGEIVWVHARGEAVRDEHGRMTGLAGFCHDITDRKKVEDSLRAAFEGERQAARRLREVDEMKNSLLQAVSHELRTPLTVIIGVSDTLARQNVNLQTDDARYLLGRLSAHAQRLHRLLMDLLDLDRLNRGIIEARPRPTEVRDLVMRVLEVLEVEKHPILVDMPATMLSVDPAHVERIVENLLANAIKHTPSGTRIVVRTDRTPEGVTLIVEDDGPGVPVELRDVIFEPFRQGETPSHAPGTGIGLSLVARFARLNGGHAWVQDREGGGSSFRVLLPAADETAAGAA